MTGAGVGLRRAASHDVVAIDTCAVAHPALDELVRDGRFGVAAEVTLRVGAGTGERLALVAPGRDDGVRLPADVLVVGADELARGKRAWFQNGPIWKANGAIAPPRWARSTSRSVPAALAKPAA